MRGEPVQSRSAAGTPTGCVSPPTLTGATRPLWKRGWTTPTSKAPQNPGAGPSGTGPSSYAGAVARASPLWRGRRAGKPGGSGRLVLLAGLGERADQVDDVADLAQAHAVAVQEVLQGELALQGVAVVAQLLD